MTALWKRRAQRAEEQEALTELAAYDPRGRVRFIRPARSHIICGRCGQPALSETTPTILEHYKKAHETAPQAQLVGGFEWMHSVGYGPLDDDEGGAMTPERLTDDCQHKNRHWRVFCVECVAEQEAHIRDLEAQVREAREAPSIDDCLYHRCVEHWTVPGRNTTASSNGAECGACIERDWRSAFENYATHHGWCASGHGGMHVLGSPGSCDCGRDAALATATPPRRHRRR